MPSFVLEVDLGEVALATCRHLCGRHGVRATCRVVVGHSFAQVRDVRRRRLAQWTVKGCLKTAVGAMIHRAQLMEDGVRGRRGAIVRRRAVEDRKGKHDCAPALHLLMEALIVVF